MKKSKIIIPALGMLLLSTAASITGTVAWFTTVSSATANITSFAVRKLGGDLDYTVAPGTGTKKSDNSDPKSAITLDGTSPALCDASYNPTSGTVWKANSNASVFTEIASESAENWSITSASPAQVTYYAVSWTYTFTYTFGGDSTAMNLYFDGAASTVTPTQITAASGSQTEQTYKGFRIAFICGARTVVWAKNQTSGNCTYVTSTSTAAGTFSNVDSTSAAGNLLTSSAPAAIGETSTGNTSRADYLGQFTTAANGNQLTVKCIAWFEGTDPNVINGSEMDSVAAALTFYTRTNG